MIRLLKWMLSVLAMLAVVACGGGGGSSGDPPFGGGGGGSTPTAADLVVNPPTASVSNDGSQTVSITVTAVDGNRSAVAGVPITIAVDNGAVVTTSGTVSNESGIITASIGIGSDRTNRTITLTATSGSVSKTATIAVRDPIAGGGSGPTLSVQPASTTVTPQAPTTVTVQVRDATGTGVPGVVVGLSTARGTLARLSVASVLTDSRGIATATLQAANAAVSGADEVLATAVVDGSSISGSAGFVVAGASATISASISATTLRISQPAPTLTATVRDASGAPVGGQVVTFTSAAGNVSFAATSALTNSNGVATTTVVPVSGGVSSADTISVSATLGTQTLQSNVAVQIVGESGSIQLTLSDSALTPTKPITASVLVKNAAGLAQEGVVVGFSSQFGLATFDAATKRTGADGIAQVTVSPRAASTAGADVVIANATVAGTALTTQASVQITPGTTTGAPQLTLLLDKTSISSATPANATARLTDANGLPVAGQVIAFRVVRDLAKTNVATALTNSAGNAVVVLSPSSSTVAGADEVSASTDFAGVSLQATRGFQVQATNVTINSFTATSSPLSAYAQTPLTLQLSGASVSSPVNLSITSACVALGKATLSPATLSTTSNTVVLQYRDNGCGAVQASDQLQAVVDGTATVRSLSLPIDPPAVSSIAFVQASPEQIFLRGSGFTESSIVTFQVRDAAGNALPGRVVELRLQTGAGDVRMEGRPVESINPPSSDPFVQTSNANGQVSVRINSGTQPTPVRVQAKLQGTTISTVSSNLSVAVGLPSQLNFSMSQGTRNIEGFNIDGTPNTYQIIAADRSGNPVPAGTSINFVSEGGQVEAVKQTQIVDGIARTTANFVSSNPRPADGRITVTAYALGEESFIDVNGNNVYDASEPFQDIGNVFKDRNFDGEFDPTDEFIPLRINNGSACVAPASALLSLDPSIPSVPDTCDGAWSGAGQVYVRRALETVFSTSTGRPIWANTTGLCVPDSPSVDLQVGPEPTQRGVFRVLGPSDVWFTGNSRIGTLSFIIADANGVRLNPMAAGTSVIARSPTTGFAVSVGGGSPIPSTTEATAASLAFEFTSTNEAVVFLSLRSPSGLETTFPFEIRTGPRSCPP